MIVRGGSTFNLNDLIDPASGWYLTQALGINELNQIVGVGTFNGQQHAFLLTPIPEPSGVLAAIALNVMLVTRRRRARA